MKKNINKSITFIYMDKGEYMLYESIAKEAEARRYKIRFSDNLFDSDDIVFYCQHVCFPQRKSKLNIVMLHDLGQQRVLWPNIWIKENWNKFDIGFLPNKEWVNMWTISSGCSFANPKIGCYQAGWPKADMLVNEIFRKEAFLLAEKIGINKNLKTVLYAPSWENDNKQLEFVECFENENINMLIKQYPCTENMYPDMYRNIQEMDKLCRGRKNVYILTPETNIFTAILLSDILVSEESSTLVEAVLAGNISISVTDWLIPDVNPPRLPVVQPEYIVKTEKKELKNTVLKILDNYNEVQNNVFNSLDNNFINIGMTGKTIMDIIDYCVQNNRKRLSELKLSRNNKIIKYSLKIRLYWIFINNKYLLFEIYKNNKDNIIIHLLYLIYKKCQKILKKI